MKKSILLATVLLSFGAIVTALNEREAIEVFCCINGPMSPVVTIERNLDEGDFVLIKDLLKTDEGSIKDQKLKIAYLYLKGLSKEVGRITIGDLRKAREKMYPMSFSEKVLFGAFACAPIALLSTLGYLAYSFAK